MLGRLIEKCVQGEGIGGMVTNGINETMKWILREDTEFPGEPRNLFIRKVPLLEISQTLGPSTVRSLGKKIAVADTPSFPHSGNRNVPDRHGLGQGQHQH